jgi:hypothetical protein
LAAKLIMGASSPWQLTQLGLRIELKTWVKVTVVAGGVPPELLLDPLDPPLEPPPASAGVGPPELAPGEPASFAGPVPPLDAPELEGAEPELPPESTSSCPPLELLELPPEFDPDELAL